MEKFTDKLISLDRFFFTDIALSFACVYYFFDRYSARRMGFSLIESHAISDAILNSVSMIGTQNLHIEPVSTLGKYFTAIYGLFLQAIFFIAVGMVVAPFVHRILHNWHIDSDNDEDEEER